MRRAFGELVRARLTLNNDVDLWYEITPFLSQILDHSNAQEFDLVKWSGEVNIPRELLHDCPGTSDTDDVLVRTEGT